MQTLLVLHFGLCANQDASIYPILWGEHVRLWNEQVHWLCFLQRSCPTMWKQQLCLELMEICNLMWYVFFKMNVVLIWWLITIDLWLSASVGGCRGANVSRRSALRRTGCSLCFQLLQPKSQIIRPGSHQLLRLPNRLALSDRTLLISQTLACECFFSLQQHHNKGLL